MINRDSYNTTAAVIGLRHPSSVSAAVGKGRPVHGQLCVVSRTNEKGREQETRDKSSNNKRNLKNVVVVAM